MDTPKEKILAIEDYRDTTLDTNCAFCGYDRNLAIYMGYKMCVVCRATTRQIEKQRNAPEKKIHYENKALVNIQRIKVCKPIPHTEYPVGFILYSSAECVGRFYIWKIRKNKRICRMLHPVEITTLVDKGYVKFI